MLIVDEIHHLTGETWHDTIADIRAPHRLGLSATIYFEREKEMAKGAIWLRACCGVIKHEVSTSDLIERGFLMRQHVKLYRVDTPDRREQTEWSTELFNECIYENTRRNAMIASFAKIYVDRNRTVMVVTNRIKQIRHLESLLARMDVMHVSVTGKEVSSERERLLKRFRSGRVPVILGTVFGEGIDVPEVEVLINAEGGDDIKKTVQKMRNLTIAEGKGKAILIDFYDVMNPYFAKHSRSRIKTYESEPAFKIRKTWLSKSKDLRA